MKCGVNFQMKKTCAMNKRLNPTSTLTEPLKLSLFLTKKVKTSKSRLLTEIWTYLTSIWKLNLFFKYWLANALSTLVLRLLKIMKRKLSETIKLSTSRWRSLNSWKPNVLKPPVTAKLRKLNVVTCKWELREPWASLLMRNLLQELWLNSSWDTSRETLSVNWLILVSYALLRTSLFNHIIFPNLWPRPGSNLTQKTTKMLLFLILWHLDCKFKLQDTSKPS